MSVHLVSHLPSYYPWMRENTMRTAPHKWINMPPVDLDNLPAVDDNAWFACVSKDRTEVYYFPLCEEENWNNGISARALNGMRGFESDEFTTYKIQ